MTNSENSNVPATWVDVFKSLSEGGLPQVIAGPAGQAISRLIGGAVEIPAAWLEQKAQRIRDETEARSLMVKAIASEAAIVAAGDPAVTQRAIDRYVQELSKKQVNREAVAQKTLELLQEEPAAVTSEGPTEDWMNVFSEYAEKASSEKLRETWARVLAGEIRKPASFSLKTLQFLSVLDQATAQAAELLLGMSFDHQYALIGQPSGDDYHLMNVARSAGLVAQLDTDTTTTKTIGSLGLAIYQFGPEAILVRAPAGTQVAISCTVLSPIATELSKVVTPKVSEKAITSLIEAIRTQGNIQRIERGTIAGLAASGAVTEIRQVWPPIS